MSTQFVASGSITVRASVESVWEAFVNPEFIKEYMFGTTVTSDWKVGSPVVWAGVWQGKPYEDRGEILRLEPGRLIEYSHYSPLSGLPDKPENYHRVKIVLTREDAGVLVSLTQDNNPSEQARKHSEKNWRVVLEGMKRLVERKARTSS